MKYSRPPDTYDVLPIPPPKEKWLHTAKWRYVEGVFRDVCRRYGYREIRTPILELTELFKRTAGEATDIVSKEMFTFVREGSDRSLTMKPEGTAPVARACLQENLLTDNPILKMYYIGQNFRYERGQKGRYRQHQQLGVEAFGAEDPAIDAEVITLAMDFYRTLGIVEMELRVNSVGTPDSRTAYKDALREYVRPFLSEMSGEGQHRFEVNPLRMLDTKNPNDLRLLAEAPKLTAYLDDASRAHFDLLQAYLTALDVPFVIDPTLVRGFDYYTKTAFEIKGRNLGAQDALGGGGRYDGLMVECGGPPTPGIGFGLGMERCLLTLEALGITLPIEDESPLAFLITLGDESITRPVAVQLLGQLRRAGLAADMDYKGGNFKKQIKRADDLGARYAILVGDQEVPRGVVQVRDQTTKTQREVRIEHVAQELGTPSEI